MEENFEASPEAIPMTKEELEEKVNDTQKLLKEGKFEEAIEGYRVCCVKA